MLFSSVCFGFFPFIETYSYIDILRLLGEKGDVILIRKDYISGMQGSSGSGKSDGTRKRIEFQEGEKVYFVENHRTVRPASVIRRRGDFYPISIGSGGITLRASRLYATEEEAQNSILNKGQNLRIPSSTMEVSNQRGYHSLYNYVNDYSPYGI